MSARVGLLVVALSSAACGKQVGHLGGADAAHTGDGGSTGDGRSYDAPPGWTTLISMPWTLTAGEQVYECDRIQVPNDIYISAWSPIAPIGTHHQVLTIDPTDSYTGINTNCSGESGTLNGEMLFAAGVGTGQLTLPAGVAVHLAAGTWINLNLHLFNETDNALAETSGVQVMTVPASEVTDEADMVFSGTETIDVPSDGQMHTAQGGCTVGSGVGQVAPAQWHVFDVWPHEHQLGVNQQITVNGTAMSSEPSTGWPFAFGEQVIYPVTQVLNQGDAILTTCTYQLALQTCNPSASPDTCTVGTCASDDYCHVKFGEYTQDEMCFTGIYKWPTSGPDSTFGCAGLP